MSNQHPDLVDEQAFIDFAYACLERSRDDAWKLRDLTEAGPGGTFQNRFERDAFDEQLINRLGQLDLGNAALVFGRIDRIEDDGIESFHIGRLAVSDENREPVVVDWRAPVAEPFYRATGRNAMGLARRRHFVVEGGKLFGIEDELFGEGHLGVGHDDGLVLTNETGLRGYNTLLASIERGRTGQLGDIVATIQSEQDEIIRSSKSGVLVVQGGPGTGKTVVALHRAAYLLYTHRFPLEDQGVLVIGPNRVFLRYIEQVLPSLGESGVEQVVLADLIPDAEFGAVDSLIAERVKGSDRMCAVIHKAMIDRQRPLKEDLVFPYRTGFIRLRKEETARIVKAARRRFRSHNAARRWVENEVFSALAATWRTDEDVVDDVKDQLRGHPDMRMALERMWPVLSPTQLLHDLFGSKALLRLAATPILHEDEYLALFRERASSLEEARWSNADVALLDEAREILGPKQGKNGKSDESDEIRTFGHVVIDEVQDLTPMQLRMASRRSLNGSMTIVGDIAQATGPLAPRDWEDVLAYLPNKKEPRVIGLSVGYRIPGQIMAIADKVMAVASPRLRAPTAVREGDAAPAIVRVGEGDELVAAVLEQTSVMESEVPGRNLAIVCPDSMVAEIATALRASGIAHGHAGLHGIGHDINVVPVSLVKGLELDGVVVVEPAAIVADRAMGLRGLYVALTRATQRLTIVHSKPLPEAML